MKFRGNIISAKRLTNIKMKKNKIMAVCLAGNLQVTLRLES